MIGREITFAFTGTADELPPTVAEPGAFRRDLTNGAPLLIDRTHQSMQGVNGAAILIGTEEVTPPTLHGATRYVAVLAEWRPDPSPMGHRRHQEFLVLSQHLDRPCSCCGETGRINVVPAAGSAMRLPQLLEILRTDDAPRMQRMLVRPEPVLSIGWHARNAREVAVLHTAIITAAVSARLRIPTGPHEFHAYAQSVASVVADTLHVEQARGPSGAPQPRPPQDVAIHITPLLDRPYPLPGTDGYGA